jgi:hypothetical protein
VRLFLSLAAVVVRVNQLVVLPVQVAVTVYLVTAVLVAREL